IDDGFFSHGGHSLLAMQLVSRVRATLGAELPVGAVFEAPTVAELATRLLGAEKAAGTPLEPQERPEQIPLSFAQQRLWFVDRFKQSSAEYNMRSALRLKGDLDVAALERALQALVERHESLRTHFGQYRDEPFQIIEPELRVSLPVEDLSGLEENSQEEFIKAASRREAEESFDLSRGPLLRIRLLKLGEQDHVLLWTCHHIISDGWSVGVFNRDLHALYEAFRQGRESPLSPLAVQYADYSIWQRRWIHGTDLKRLMDYWREQLAGATTLNLLNDRPRPLHPSYQGARQSFVLSSEASARLEEFNRREKVTAFMSLLAAFQVLLSRYSGQEDILIGTPVANRSNVCLEKLIGFFVNTIVLRGDLSGEPSFREVVSRVRRTALAAYQHQELSFEKLVEELNPERDMSRHPLFQVVFALQNAPQQELSLGGLDISRQSQDSSITRFDLELHLWAEGDHWGGSLVGRRDIFEHAAIEAMARAYVALLEGLLSTPDLPVSVVSVMSPAERELILINWNATRRDYPCNKGIPELFQEQVKRSPEAVALVFGEQEITYGELDTRSSQLASYLRSLGVRRGRKVALCMESSCEMVIALVGILKAGAAYVPIDPKYPQERVSFMLRDTEASVLLTHKGLSAAFAKDVRIVCLDTDWELMRTAAEPVEAVASRDAEDLAYIIYTSGSTGEPKGVCVPQRAIIRLVMSTDYVELGSSDVVPQLSNCCFDAATFEIWGALLNGSRLVGIGLERLLSVELFAEELARHHVTTMFLTTALFNEIVRERPGIFQNVRNVLFGGEECDPEVVRAVLRNGAPARLLHVYGPTETTTFASWYQIPSTLNSRVRIPIGRPVANAQIYILDSHHNPTPIGVPGELWIGGDGLAHGYLKRPELTAERFIQSPFEPFQKLYRTGDRARFLPDGNIDFLGRLDNQVKIRGFRIELGEIESVLREHPSVDATVVVVRTDQGGKQVVAYVVGAASSSANEAELREFLHGKLPSYMVPSAIVLLDRLPLTSNGKIDQKALPAPIMGEERDEFEAPGNETEKIVAAVWS
ncbi:MAG TPA: amino acid adenylation domain-containing protein, partial [Terrimicrobiaceae bacterium]